MMIWEWIAHAWSLMAGFLVAVQFAHWCGKVVWSEPWHNTLLHICMVIVAQAAWMRHAPLLQYKSPTPDNEKDEHGPLNSAIQSDNHRLPGISVTKGIAMIFVGVIHSHDSQVLKEWWIHRQVVDKAVPILLICAGITAFHRVPETHMTPKDKWAWSVRRIRALVPLYYVAVGGLWAFRFGCINYQAKHAFLSHNHPMWQSVALSLLPTSTCVGGLWFVTMFACLLFLAPWIRPWTRHIIMPLLFMTSSSYAHGAAVAQFKQWVSFLSPACDGNGFMYIILYWPRWVAYFAIGMQLTKMKYFRRPQTLQTTLCGFLLCQMAYDLQSLTPVLRQTVNILSDACLTLTLISVHNLFPSTIHRALSFVGNNSYDFYIGNILLLNLVVEDFTMSTFRYLPNAGRVLTFPILALVLGCGIYFVGQHTCRPLATSNVSSSSSSSRDDPCGRRDHARLFPMKMKRGMQVVGLGLLVFWMYDMGKWTIGKQENILFSPPPLEFVARSQDHSQHATNIKNEAPLFVPQRTDTNRLLLTLPSPLPPPAMSSQLLRIGRKIRHLSHSKKEDPLHELKHEEVGRALSTRQLSPTLQMPSKDGNQPPRHYAPSLTANHECAVFTLVRGKPTLAGFNDFKNRTVALEQVVKESYDNYAFHEGDVPPDVISTFWQAHRVQFINVHEFGGFDPSSVPTKMMVRGPNDYPVGYKHMCRFFSWQWIRIFKNYKYVMRIDEDVIVHHVDQSPFRYIMQNPNIVYAYGMETTEKHAETLYTYDVWLSSYLAQRKKSPVDVRYMYFTNVFLTRVDFWLRADVNEFLQDIDRTGHIYHHRWGDAPIQTSALKIFAQPTQISFMRIDYSHASTGNEIKNGRETTYVAHHEAPSLFDNFVSTFEKCVAPCLVANEFHLGGNHSSYNTAVSALKGAIMLETGLPLEMLDEYSPYKLALAYQLDVKKASHPLPPDHVTSEARLHAHTELLGLPPQVSDKERLRAAETHECCKEYRESSITEFLSSKRQQIFEELLEQYSRYKTSRHYKHGNKHRSSSSK